MNNVKQHRQAVMIPQPDKIEEIRELLIECEKQISLKIDEGGPDLWFASFDEAESRFYVESVFSSEEALVFHQNNIGAILKNMPPLLAAPLETTIHSVFTLAK